jgi:MFS transporter, PAT family, beta-lactamase induction signal transducer AmpG
VSVFGALQDGATDGMAVDTIPAHQQARANGFMGGARMIGSSLALALGSWLLNQYDFRVAMGTLSVLIGLMTLVPLLLREQPGEKLLPWTAGAASAETTRMQLSNWRVILNALFSMLRLRNSLLVALLMFTTMGAYNYFETLLPLFAVKVSGWTNVAYSRAFATADLIGGIGGMLLGGYLIERFGKKRMITLYFLVIIALTTALIFLTQFWQNTPFLYGFIMAYRWFNAFAKIGTYAVAMECCSRKISASQFTTFMTLGATGSMVGATLIGPVKDRFDWPGTFLLFVGLMALAGVIMQLIDINQQAEQITELEQEEASVLVS